MCGLLHLKKATCCFLQAFCGTVQQDTKWVAVKAWNWGPAGLSMIPVGSQHRKWWKHISRGRLRSCQLCAFLGSEPVLPHLCPLSVLQGGGGGLMCILSEICMKTA